MIWGRQLIRRIVDPSVQRGLSPTFCGHTPVAEVTRIGAQIFVDTGAFATSGALTLFDVHADRAYSVSTLEARRRGANLLSWPGTALAGK
jgi:serine/threonine protein phosphatase 1